MTSVNLDPSRELLGYLVRHGELKNMNIWDGWADYQLSDKGRESAESAARWLSFVPLGRLISSDVARTIETSSYIEQSCHLACPFVGFDPNLRPWMVAGFTGKEKTPERVAEFKKYIENPDLVIPGGESRKQLNIRIQVIFEYLTSPYDAKPTVIVCHNSVIKSLMGIDDIADAVAPGGIVSVWMNDKCEIDFQVELGQVVLEKGVS